VREALAAELHAHIGRVHGREAAPEGFRGAPLDWPSCSDAELEAALRSLIEEGYVPDNGETAA
jgi:hypothetical protein